LEQRTEKKREQSKYVKKPPGGEVQESRGTKSAGQHHPQISCRIGKREVKVRGGGGEMFFTQEMSLLNKKKPWLNLAGCMEWAGNYGKK